MNAVSYTFHDARLRSLPLRALNRAARARVCWARAAFACADFEGPGRPYTAPLGDSDFNEAPNYLESMARREGLEPPTLRFEA